MREGSLACKLWPRGTELGSLSQSVQRYGFTEESVACVDSQQIALCGKLAEASHM